MAMNLDNEEEEADEGEAWLGSFADMMSLLLGFFMILYSMSHMDEKKFYEFGKSISQSFKKDETKSQSVALDEMTVTDRKLRAFQMLIAVLNLGEEEKAVSRVEQLYTQKVTGAKADKELEAAMEKVGELDRSNKPNLSEEETILKLILPAPILFESGTAEMTPRASEQLRKLSKVLLAITTRGYFEITGHTDSQKPGPNAVFADNWSLSAARAAAVARELTRFGVRPDLLRVRGMASFDPMFPEYTRKGKPISRNMDKNRRIEVAVKRAL